MIKEKIILCLMAILILSIEASADGIDYTLTINTLSCSETFIEPFSQQTISNLWITDGAGNILNSKQTAIPSDTSPNTVSITTDITQIPCNSLLVCFSSLDGDTIQKTIIKSCTPPTTLPGSYNISPGNNSNITGINYGTMPYNITGNLSGTSTILGLSKDFFFKIVALIILTIIAVNVRPIQVSLIGLFIGLNLFTDVLGILTLPITLTLLIMLLMLLEIVKRRKYQ